MSADAPEPPLSRYLNRELTWLAFNERVLEEAEDARNPLLERLRFLMIFQTNLDEFFMVRVSGLRQQVLAGVDVVSFDGLSPKQQLARIGERLRPLLMRARSTLNEELLPAIDELGVRLVHYDDLSEAEQARWDDWYLRKVHPVLTPLAVGPTQTFPFISNLSNNLAVMVRSASGERRLARIKVPAVLPPLLVLDRPGHEIVPPTAVMPLPELIAANLHLLFPGMKVSRPWRFRVTRDADIAIREDEADDLLTSIQEELRNRRFGRAVRLEVQAGMPANLCRELRRGLDLDGADIYEVAPPLDVTTLKAIVDADLPEHKFPPFVPHVPSAARTDDLFAAIRRDDLLLHHPYESFNPVVEFLQAAAADPDVLAIKQTLYRTSGDSPVVRALADAVEAGKQVAALIELKARFDEENNILWAQHLEETGVHVVYGLPGIKVHSKLAMVVRREGDELRRYAHLGTGNYNPNTARLYTDLGLFTADPDLTADVADIFNHLTGFSEPPGYRKLLVASRFMRAGLIERIRREAEHARAGHPAQLVFKCNSITEPKVIDALYEASQAGVTVDLNVRGICCVIPGKPGLSDNIRVRSVLGRFLEHSRVYWFANGGDPEVYIGSADLMDRNLKRRVEVLAPIDHPGHKRWLRERLLQPYLDDTERSRDMLPDGTYVRRRSDNGDGLDVQDTFLARSQRGER